jgi:YcaO-like protein with predicted kinase domain
MTIRDLTEQADGTIAPLVNLNDAPPAVDSLVRRITQAGLRVFVMRSTVDIPLPIYKALIFDPGESHAAFYGYGTSIFDCVAVEKAILEAIQGRAVYIAGARDDISRSRFDMLKRLNQKGKIVQFDLIQPKLCLDWSSYDITTEEELGWAVQDIGPWAGSMFIKVLVKDFVAAKVIIPGLEAPFMDGWTSVGRWEQLKNDGKNSNLRWPDSLRV